MTADNPAVSTVEEQVAEVLAGHQWHHTRETHCACGFRTPLAQLALDGYLAHVAQVLAPLIADLNRAAAAEAWDEGWNAAGDAYVRGMDAYATGLPMPESDGPPNPYRADAVAGEGEEVGRRG